MSLVLRLGREGWQGNTRGLDPRGRGATEVRGGKFRVLKPPRSHFQATNRPDAPAMPSIVALLFLYCSSIVPLLAVYFSAWSARIIHAEPREPPGGAGASIPGLDRLGLAIKQIASPFPVEALMPRRQTADLDFASGRP
jgi:hypothetical protein